MTINSPALKYLAFVGFVLFVFSGCQDSHSPVDDEHNPLGLPATHLSKNSEGSSVLLIWDGYVGEEWVGFNVYLVNLYNTPLLLDTVTASEHRFFNLQSGKTYEYVVKSVHCDGYESQPTNTVEVIVGEINDDPADDPDGP